MPYYLKGDAIPITYERFCMIKHEFAVSSDVTRICEPNFQTFYDESGDGVCTFVDEYNLKTRENTPEYYMSSHLLKYIADY